MKPLRAQAIAIKIRQLRQQAKRGSPPTVVVTTIHKGPQKTQGISDDAQQTQTSLTNGTRPGADVLGA